MSSSSLYIWGSNDYGQLGDGTLTRRSKPEPIVASPRGVSVVAVAMGNCHTLALDSAGGLHAWGRGDGGLLGDGGTADQVLPVALADKGSLAGKTLVAVAAGIRHSLALDSVGGLYAWGSGDSERLGDGGTFDQVHLPVALAAGRGSL